MRLYFTALLISLGFLGFSQNSLNYAQIDTLSYNAYLNKDWNEVKSIGKKSIKQDIDYFFLRMRLGIAYYEQENYRKAAQHFDKALEYNPDDSLATEYLFYANKFANLDMQASLSLTKSHFKNKNKFSDQQFWVKNIYAFYGFRSYNNINFQKLNQQAHEYEYNSLNNDTTRFSTRTIAPKSYKNFQIGATFRVKPFWEIEVAYQYYKVESDSFAYVPHPINSEIYQKTIDYVIPLQKDRIDSLANSLYSIKGSNNLKASQLYIKNEFLLNKNFKLYLFGDYQTYTINSKYKAQKFTNDTIVYFESPTSFATDTIITNYKDLERKSKISDHQILLGVAVQYIQAYYELEVSTNFLSTINKPSLQSDFSAKFLPFGNNKLTAGISLTYLKYEKDKSNMLFSPFINITPIERVNIKFSASFGERKNWQTDYGYSVYNSVYKIHNIYRTALTVRIYKTMYLKVHYEYLERSTDIKAGSLAPQNGIQNKEIETIKFGTHSIISGIIWEF